MEVEGLRLAHHMTGCGDDYAHMKYLVRAAPDVEGAWELALRPTSLPRNKS